MGDKVEKLEKNQYYDEMKCPCLCNGTMFFHCVIR